MPSRLPGLALLVALFVLASTAAASEPSVATDRWYEIRRGGAKVGHQQVVWAPSTWEGRPTVHDTTTITERSVRNMMGIRDVFETVTRIDLERGDDGTMWWMQASVEEAGRVTSSETRWTGKGYEQVSRLDGEVQTLFVPLDEPVMTDAEAFLGSRIRAGEVQVGDTFDLRLLDLSARGALVTKLEVLARETLADEAAVDEEGKPVRIATLKVRERDPRSGGTTTLWLDGDGAFVKIVAEGGITYHRLAREAAEQTPVRPAEFAVTTPSTPKLERVMSADRLYLDLHLRGDPDRPLPEFPTSRFSHTEKVRGSDEEGWVVEMVLEKFEEPDATATLPMDTTGLERHLESTVLMPTEHEQVRGVVQAVIGEEKDAREAAYLLARYVHERLGKRSPEVAQASALEILESGMGDCSEHALLFVTLCRAAGIPARQCSGYVNIGSMWGAHAWAEIWLGRWVGADPTTGEIGTGARYVLFGYHDDPNSFPGLVTSRTRERMRFVATRIVEGDDDYDLTSPEDWRIQDEENHRYVHVLAGLEARDAPQDWVVRLSGTDRMLIRGPGFRAELRTSADQGMQLHQIGMGGGQTTFAGAPAIRNDMPGRGVGFFVHSRRRLIQLFVETEEDVDELLPRLEQVLAPTFAPVPKKAPEPAVAAEAEDE